MQSSCVVKFKGRSSRSLAAGQSLLRRFRRPGGGANLLQSSELFSDCDSAPWQGWLGSTGNPAVDTRPKFNSFSPLFSL